MNKRTRKKQIKQKAIQNLVNSGYSKREARATVKQEKDRHSTILRDSASQSKFIENISNMIRAIEHNRIVTNKRYNSIIAHIEGIASLLQKVKADYDEYLQINIDEDILKVNTPERLQAYVDYIVINIIDYYELTTNSQFVSNYKEAATKSDASRTGDPYQDLLSIAQEHFERNNGRVDDFHGKNVENAFTIMMEEVFYDSEQEVYRQALERSGIKAGTQSPEERRRMMDK